MKKLLYILAGIIILVIIIIAIASNGEEKKETIPEQQPPQEQELAWHDVISFNGEGDSIKRNTKLFIITGTQWRIIWTFEDSGEFGEETNGLFIVNIYDLKERLIGQISYTGLSSKGTDYFYKQGEFYLEIATYNSKNYSIEIQQEI